MSTQPPLLNVIPISTVRSQLPLKAVLIHCLDENSRAVSSASGFLVRDQGELYLYTCWHVVTGYDKNQLRIGMSLPKPRMLKIELAIASQPGPGVTAIGGLQVFALPLYREEGGRTLPAWQQDQRHIPNPDLNSVGIYVPFWHDTVRIPIRVPANVHEWQRIDSLVDRTATPIQLGDKVYIVGFPYGFSAYGAMNPFPICLTRFVASVRCGLRRQEFLLESSGAPSMSGAPVFVENENGIRFVGQYTGHIYPDHAQERNERTTALGSCVDLSLHFSNERLPFMNVPDLPDTP